jgi:hypothetical protein
MKKAIFTFAILLGLSAASYAQIEIKGGGGINFLGLSENHDDYKSEGQVGYQFGAGVLIGEKFYVEPSVYWQRNTSFLIENNDPENAEYKTSINSIRIPVHVGYHIIGGKEEKFVSLRVFLGPAGTIITGVKSDLSGVEKGDLNSFLFDLDGGLGLDIWFIFIDAQYQFGFSKLYKDGSDGKLRGFTANAGLRIPF